MQITTAMLADSAQVQGGKLFVLGGGFDTINTKTLPAVHHTLSLVLVAVVSPEERHRPLKIVIELLDEDGHQTGIEAIGNLRVGAPPHLLPGASSTVPIVSPFPNLRLNEAKGYTFVVSYEGEQLARVPFRVILAE